MKPVPHSRPTLGPREAAAAARVVRSGVLAEGPETAALEAEAARLCGARYGAAVTSGTKAVELALRAMGVGRGDEVLIPTFVCSSLWHAAERAGATPVLVDCEEGGFNASMKDAARKRTRRTKAIVVAHLFGAPADLAGARSLGVPILEDCAQALGGTWRGKPLGSFGRAAVLSFYATKLVAAGEGGMVVSSDRRLVERVRALGRYDEKPPVEPLENAKFSDLQAAVARVQLSRLPSFIRDRRRLAGAYTQALSDLAAGLPEPSRDGVPFRYVIRLARERIDDLVRAGEREGVAVRRAVYRPLHLDVPCRGAFPNADRAWAACLSIPLYPSLGRVEQARVVSFLRRKIATL